MQIQGQDRPETGRSKGGFLMCPLAEVLSNILDLPPFSWYVNRQQKYWDQEQARRSKLCGFKPFDRKAEDTKDE